MLETPRLIIRESTSKDYSLISEMYNKADNMKHILDGKYEWKLEEVIQKWEATRFNSSTGIGFLVVEYKPTREVIGECGLINYDSATATAEIAYLIDERYWGLGLGLETGTTLLEFGFNTLNLKTIFATMYKENVRSSKLIEKLNFKTCKEGKTASNVEYVVYQISKENFLTIEKNKLSK